MKNRSIALILAILIIATLLTPMCFANEEVYPVLDVTAEKDIAVAPEAEDDATNVLTVGADNDEDEKDAPKMIFEPMNFVKNLYYMGLGMLGIFVVIGVIILATAAINKFFKEKKDE